MVVQAAIEASKCSGCVKHLLSVNSVSASIIISRIPGHFKNGMTDLTDELDRFPAHASPRVLCATCSSAGTVRPTARSKHGGPPASGISVTCACDLRQAKANGGCVYTPQDCARKRSQLYDRRRRYGVSAMGRLLMHRSSRNRRLLRILQPWRRSTFRPRSHDPRNQKSKCLLCQAIPSAEYRAIISHIGTKQTISAS
ncbi:hypothetical protein PHLGIDRAFT_138337 [Phlebiopsis gigantea 11061_1 CR5-6]|uniref:Uncharacterized protein n=1 Tax=Phlebiopsis gigantea (strain 11061_1 CR5-6) TaxID=745531 RepID=A0A0C3P4G8_PHLG1|nr:hypothetical protein PHLGIDRAFT_138337 [Phlebiopsis gigantea 11061_1 CR5-6]